jgi:Ca2+-binding EF-hand superfamily protein
MIRFGQRGASSVGNTKGHDLRGGTMARFSWIAVSLLVAFLLAGVRTRCVAEEKPKPANTEPSQKPPSAEELRRAAEKELAKQDQDGDARLTLDEFLADTSGDERGQKRQRFFEWDVDEDGRLTVDELDGRGKGGRLSAAYDFRRRDGNDDGQVSLQEFLACEAEPSRLEAKRLFGVLDFDGSESLSRDEFLVWPGRLPIDRRPRVPDPLADARRAAFDSWKTLFASADSDGDGALNEGEWPASKLAAALPGIGEIAFASWDREGDGRVDESDGRWLFDLAYGFIRPDGKPLRGNGGDVLSWGWLRGLDTGGDGRLSRDEFVSRFNLGNEKNEELFDYRDTDGDGQLDDEELRPIFTIDVLSQFLALDADFDGHLAHDELVKAFGGRIPNIVERILPAFDGDGDGRLSLYEFRMLPYTNPLTYWDGGRLDADHDGRLSWQEYYLEAPPLLIGLNRHFFDHFDLDKDGFLSLDEWDFHVDFMKVPPEVAIRIKDRNGDGKLQFAELFSEKQPDGAGKAVEAYRRRLAEAEDRFRGADRDADRALAPKELVAWFQAEAKAAVKAARGEAERPAMEASVRLSPAADFRRRDENGDGRLSLEEMLSCEDEKGRPNARRLFAVLDFDKSATLSADEFSAWPGRLPLTERPSVPDPLTDLRRTAFDTWKALCAAADSDGDGVFTAREWPTKKIAAAVPALADLPFSEWDRNRDGRVEEAEAGRILDLAYGVARPDGKPLRGNGGDVLSWGWLRGLDTNGDGRLSRDEFVPRFNLGKERNEELFKDRDADGDGQLDDEELRPIFTIDVLSQFLALDTDFDGQLAHDELVKAFGGRIPNIVERILPAFDGDGDGRLSLYEFRMLPYTNPLTYWDGGRLDADHDGRLSWQEYYLEAPPLLIGLNRHFFDHFDLDKDGFLSLDEWDFHVDFMKVPPEVAIRIKDRNGDGKLQFAELFSEKQPDGAGKAVEAYRRRLAEAEDRFGGADRDADGALAPKELVAWFQAEAKAAVKAAQDEAERLAMEQAKKVFSELDKNGDQELVREEFLSGATGDLRGQKHWQFFTWDVDEDQKLSLEEFLRKAEGVRLSPAAAFRRRDENGDGSLSLDEMLSREDEKGRPNARRLFAVLDFDKSETLSADEFSAWPGRLPLTERPSVPDPLTDLRRTAFDTWKALCAAADSDGDGVFTAREWPTKKIAAAVPAFADLPFSEWDRNRDGRVEEAEAGRIFDLAYGVARPDGKPLRWKGGGVLSWGWLRGLDSNGDGRLSRNEFVSRFNLGKERNEALFKDRDADGNGELDDEELRPIFIEDVLSQFLSLDADLDGRLGHDELVKAFGGRIPNIVERLLPAFDGDGDGRLSLYEFRMLPYTNPLTHWDVRRMDADHDGRLSWQEYYLETPPLLVGLNRHFFDHFDLNKDGFLSLNEWDFDVDLSKAPGEVGLRARDKDGDGKLTFAEVFLEKKPSDGDQQALDRYEMRLAHAENRFLSDDKDGSGYLDLEELTQSQESAMEAARKHSQALVHRKHFLEGNYWVRKGVLVVNEIAFITGVWMIVRRQRPKGRRADQGSTTEP